MVGRGACRQQAQDQARDREHVRLERAGRRQGVTELERAPAGQHHPRGSQDGDLCDRGPRQTNNVTPVPDVSRFVFSWAIGVGKLKANPIEHLPKRGKEVVRDRTLARVEKDGAINGREIALLWRACEIEAYPLGDIVKLLLLTCCRESEIAGLRWDQVRGDELWLDTDDTKNGTFHIVPLSAPAKAILDGVKRIKSCPFVFTVTGTGPYTSWSLGKARLAKEMRRLAIEADDSAPLPEWRIHDLRRTGATLLEGLGVPILVTEALLNHKGTKKGVARIYQRHEYQAEKRAAANLLGAEIERIVHGGKLLPIRRAA